MASGQSVVVAEALAFDLPDVVCIWVVESCSGLVPAPTTSPVTSRSSAPIGFSAGLGADGAALDSAPTPTRCFPLRRWDALWSAARRCRMRRTRVGEDHCGDPDQDRSVRLRMMMLLWATAASFWAAAAACRAPSARGPLRPGRRLRRGVDWWPRLLGHAWRGPPRQCFAPSSSHRWDEAVREHERRWRGQRHDEQAGIDGVVGRRHEVGRLDRSPNHVGDDGAHRENSEGSQDPRPTGRIRIKKLGDLFSYAVPPVLRRGPSVRLLPGGLPCLVRWLLPPWRARSWSRISRHYPPSTALMPPASLLDNGRRFLQELPTQRRKDYARVCTSISHRPYPWRDRCPVRRQRELGEIIEDVARLGARLIIQTAVEAEVEVFLGRARYQRRAAEVPGRGSATATAMRRSRPRPGR